MMTLIGLAVLALVAWGLYCYWRDLDDPRDGGEP